MAGLPPKPSSSSERVFSSTPAQPLSNAPLRKNRKIDPPTSVPFSTGSRSHSNTNDHDTSTSYAGNTDKTRNTATGILSSVSNYLIIFK